MQCSWSRSAASIGLTISTMLSLLSSTVAAESKPLNLTLQTRVETRPGSGEFKVAAAREKWDPRKTAILVCDMWDLHHSKNAVKREG